MIYSKNNLRHSIIYIAQEWYNLVMIAHSSDFQSEEDSSVHNEKPLSTLYFYNG